MGAGRPGAGGFANESTTSSPRNLYVVDGLIRDARTRRALRRRTLSGWGLKLILAGPEIFARHL